MSPVALSECDPETRKKALQQMEETEGVAVESTVIAATPTWLVELEAVIHKGQQSYVEIGRALAEIQSSRLYKTTYSTFEEYCEKRWGFVRSVAYDYIRAAKVDVGISLQESPTFSQAVELARLEPSQQREVAAAINFSTATVRDVKKAADTRLGTVPEPAPVEPKEISLEAALEMFVTKIVLQPYGYSAAKFAKYPQQHTVDLQMIELKKWSLYETLLTVIQTVLSKRKQQHAEER